MKKITIAALLMSGAMLMSGCANKNDTVVITVGDEEVTATQLDFCTTKMMQLDIGNAEYVADILEETLLAKEIAEAEGFQKTEEDDSDIKRAIINFRRNNGGTKAANEMLAKYDISEEFMSTLYMEQRYNEFLKDKIVPSEITDEDRKNGLDDVRYHATHVLVLSDDTMSEEQQSEAKKKADDILARAKAGEDFNALVTEFGEDPGMQSNPDGYTFGMGEMVPEFETMTRYLGINEIGMCKTSYGYHIIKRLPLYSSDEEFEAIYEEFKDEAESAVKINKNTEAIKAKAAELNIAVNIDKEKIAKIEPIE